MNLEESEIEGMPHNIGPPEKRLLHTRFKCRSCGRTTAVGQKGIVLVKPTRCEECGKKRFDQLEPDLTDLLDFQMLELRPVEGGLHTISAELRGENVGTIPSNALRIRARGTYELRQRSPRLTVYDRVFVIESLDVEEVLPRLHETKEKLGRKRK